MTVVITGSSGFLGQALLRTFSAFENKIICLVRKDPIKPISDNNVTYIIYSEKMDNADIVSKLAAHNPEYFIHSAWKGTAGEERNSSFQISYNIPLVMDSVRLAYAAGCKQWIGVGSQAEYGVRNEVIVETDLANPNTLYGQAKLSAGVEALELCSKLGINGVWNRIFSLYGPQDNEKYFIPYIINCLIKNKTPELTSCEQLWDYLYADDAAKAFYLQCTNKCEGIFNICSGTAISLKSVVELIQLITGSNTYIEYGSVPYSKNQIMHLAGNCDKLKKQTGWNPETSLEEGLKRTINYYRQIESN